MITTRRVVKQWRDSTLQPCSGTVVFQLTAPLEEDPGLRAVVPSPVVATLDQGDMAVDLPTTDIGTGAVYKVIPKLIDAAGNYLYAEPKCPPPVERLRPFHVLIPPGETDLELPPATYPDSGYVAVQGPAGVGVLFLGPGEEIPPGTVPPMLVVQQA